jgi:hypothetical protein
MPGLVEPYDDLTGAVQQVRSPSFVTLFPFFESRRGISTLVSGQSQRSSCDGADWRVFGVQWFCSNDRKEGTKQRVAKDVAHTDHD